MRYLVPRLESADYLADWTVYRFDIWDRHARRDSVVDSVVGKRYGESDGCAEVLATFLRCVCVYYDRNYTRPLRCCLLHGVETYVGIDAPH